MTPDLQASLLCDDVRQERNGKFILIGIFDIIGVPSLPMVFPRVCVVNRWCCGSGGFQQRSRLLRPDGVRVLVEGKPVPIRLPGDEATATSVEVFMNVRIEEEGTHWVEVLLDGDLKLRYPLRVSVIKPPAGHEAPPAEPA
jgi:hypothetical protein